ncbi:DUF2511 domain-containing protein [Streptomyces sp. H39-C1]|uniref:DUF2511 domain-containing protein n=1 Tax=Streptomyces sp. H39-C1 TaxID=3004355 RepID=UPI0022AE5D76|nr:DUF2511 domain-containing protein [Streptomyces sp. H39-C1]MCZ4099856.1 DUF2511 domain-containing protein [Streptomyces sp. H39-C1]
MAGHYDTDPRTVFKQEFTTWPFTVSSGRIRCALGKAVTFSANGQEYALNGLAKGQGYPEIDPIWRDDPNLGNGLKVDISEVLNAALAMCP